MAMYTTCYHKGSNVLCRGSNDYGIRGGSTSTTPNYVLENGANLDNVIDLSGDYTHMCALTKESDNTTRIKCWGSNSKYESGGDTTSNVTTANEVFILE